MSDNDHISESYCYDWLHPEDALHVTIDGFQWTVAARKGDIIWVFGPVGNVVDYEVKHGS